MHNLARQLQTSVYSLRKYVSMYTDTPGPYWYVCNANEILQYHYYNIISVGPIIAIIDVRLESLYLSTINFFITQYIHTYYLEPLWSMVTGVRSVWAGGRFERFSQHARRARVYVLHLIC